MDFPALAQRLIHPRTDTVEAAWAAATNSGYAAIIMGLSHVLLGTLLMASPAPVAAALIQIGVGAVYLILARVAFRRSRVVSIAILVLIILDALLELLLSRGFGLNHVVLIAAFVLAVGGLRGANAVFTRHGRPGLF